MSQLTTATELAPPQFFKGLIYGQPGTGKSTLALSAPNPVMIDCDRGMHRVEPKYRTASLQANSYQEILDLVNGEELTPFETIVIDTLGKLVDFMCDHVAKKNPKLRQGDGQITMKGWGEVKSAFHAFFKLVVSKRKNIIFVAHESEEKVGDNTKKRPDCSGSARKDIVKELDWMGYVEMVGKNRTIGFFPTEQYYAKNAIGIDGIMEIPATTDKRGNTFISREIAHLSQQRLDEENAIGEKYRMLLSVIDSNIDGLENAEQVNEYYAEMGKKEVVLDSPFYEKRKLNDHIAKINVEFDKATKTFVDKPKEAKPAKPTTAAA